MTTPEDFDAMVTSFLAAQDDGRDHEWYCTERQLAEQLLHEVRTHLFAKDDALAARRAQYEELKKEFES